MPIKAACAQIIRADRYLFDGRSSRIDNPLISGSSILRYVGTKTFGQPRQIGVPLVVNQFRDGDFHTLFVGTAE